MRELAVLAVMLFGLVVVTGCLWGGSAQSVRQGFMENDAATYTTDGELSYTISTSAGPPQTTSLGTEAAVNRSGRSLRVNRSFVTEVGGQFTRSRTTTYLVNDSVYSKVGGTASTEWRRFDGPAEVNATWQATDTLALYTSVLGNASVRRVGVQEVWGREAHALNVEPGASGRTRLLLGKFRDAPGLFRNQSEFNNFNMTVWISTESLGLLRAETNAELTVTRSVRGREAEFDVSLRFVDTYGYGKVDIQLPSEAIDETGLAP